MTFKDLTLGVISDQIIVSFLVRKILQERLPTTKPDFTFFSNICNFFWGGLQKPIYFYEEFIMKFITFDLFQKFHDVNYTFSRVFQNEGGSPVIVLVGTSLDLGMPSLLCVVWG